MGKSSFRVFGPGEGLNEIGQSGAIKANTNGKSMAEFWRSKYGSDVELYAGLDPEFVKLIGTDTYLAWQPETPGDPDCIQELVLRTIRKAGGDPRVMRKVGRFSGGSEDVANKAYLTRFRGALLSRTPESLDDFSRILDMGFLRQSSEGAVFSLDYKDPHRNGRRLEGVDQAAQNLNKKNFLKVDDWVNDGLKMSFFQRVYRADIDSIVATHNVCVPESLRLRYELRQDGVYLGQGDDLVRVGRYIEFNHFPNVNFQWGETVQTLEQKTRLVPGEHFTFLDPVEDPSFDSSVAQPFYVERDFSVGGISVLEKDRVYDAEEAIIAIAYPEVPFLHWARVLANLALYSVLGRGYMAVMRHQQNAIEQRDRAVDSERKMRDERDAKEHALKRLQDLAGEVSHNVRNAVTQIDHNTHLLGFGKQIDVFDELEDLGFDRGREEPLLRDAFSLFHGDTVTRREMGQAYRSYRSAGGSVTATKFKELHGAYLDSRKKPRFVVERAAKFISEELAKSEELQLLMLRDVFVDDCLPELVGGVERILFSAGVASTTNVDTTLLRSTLEARGIKYSDELVRLYCALDSLPSLEDGSVDLSFGRVSNDELKLLKGSYYSLKRLDHTIAARMRFNEMVENVGRLEDGLDACARAASRIAARTMFLGMVAQGNVGGLEGIYRTKERIKLKDLVRDVAAGYSTSPINVELPCDLYVNTNRISVGEALEAVLNNGTHYVREVNSAEIYVWVVENEQDVNLYVGNTAEEITDHDVVFEEGESTKDGQGVALAKAQRRMRDCNGDLDYVAEQGQRLDVLAESPYSSIGTDMRVIFSIKINNNT